MSNTKETVSLYGVECLILYPLQQGRPAFEVLPVGWTDHIGRSESKLSKAISRAKAFIRKYPEKFGYPSIPYPFEVWDRMNKCRHSRHRTLAAALREEIRQDRAIKRVNGNSAYFWSEIRECGRVPDYASKLSDPSYNAAFEAVYG